MLDLPLLAFLTTHFIKSSMSRTTDAVSKRSSAFLGPKNANSKSLKNKIISDPMAVPVIVATKTARRSSPSIRPRIPPDGPLANGIATRAAIPK